MKKISITIEPGAKDYTSLSYLILSVGRAHLKNFVKRYFNARILCPCTAD